MTLKDFKAAIDREGNHRYHFKALDPEFGTVKEEVQNSWGAWVASLLGPEPQSRRLCDQYPSSLPRLEEFPRASGPSDYSRPLWSGNAQGTGSFLSSRTSITLTDWERESFVSENERT